MSSASGSQHPSTTPITILGILMVVFGVFAVASPLASGVGVAIVVGAFVLMGGIAEIVFALRAPSLGRGMLRFLVGGLTALCGLFMLGHPLFGLASLTLFLAAYFLIEGGVRVAFALQIRPVKGWGLAMVNGILSFVLGILLWAQWPLSGAWAIGLLFGIRLMMGGWTLIGLASAVRAGETGLPGAAPA